MERDGTQDGTTDSKHEVTDPDPYAVVACGLTGYLFLWHEAGGARVFRWEAIELQEIP